MRALDIGEAHSVGWVREVDVVGEGTCGLGFGSWGHLERAEIRREMVQMERFA